MGHIHQEAGQHDLTVSAYIVYTGDGEPTIWLHKHKLLGTWLQFGGHVELDENPWEALTHEIREESGYEMNQLNVLQPQPLLKLLSTTQQLPLPCAPNSHRFGDTEHFHTDYGVAFVTDQLPQRDVEAGESKDLQLFDVEAIDKLSPDEMYDNVRTISKFVLEQLLHVWTAVPTGEFNR